MATTLQELSKLRIFAQLDEDALQAIAPYVHERRYALGGVIIREGEPCRVVWFVAKGLVRASRLSSEGREQILAYIGSGEPLNLVSVLDGGPNLATVAAVTDTTLYAIPGEQFWWIAYHYQEVAQAVLKGLATEVRRLSDVVEELALSTVRARLARFLLAQAEAGPTRQCWTQGEIAVHIGSAPDMVRRTLWAFAGEGLIRRERGRIVVVDQEGLEREATPSPTCSCPDKSLEVDRFQQIMQGTLRAAGHPQRWWHPDVVAD